MTSKKIKPLSLLCILGGVVLIVVAVALFVGDVITKKAGIADNGEVVAFFDSTVTEKNIGIKEERYNYTMPVLSYGGNDYAAIIEVPSTGTRLPVLAEWNSKRISVVPCRYSGSPYDGTLIIGGSDASQQFDFIDTIDAGDKVTVTDMTGLVFNYKVEVVKHSDSANAAVLVDKNYDLTLFAKSTQTGKYTIVRCVCSVSSQQ